MGKRERVFRETSGEEKGVERRNGLHEIMRLIQRGNLGSMRSMERESELREISGDGNGFIR